MQKNDAARSAVLSLISERYASDADFEREAGLAPKTVSNWRRGRSSSYTRMLPLLASLFGVHITDLLPGGGTEDALETTLVYLWRSTAELPNEKRRALAATIESVIRLYLAGEEKE